MSDQVSKRAKKKKILKLTQVGDTYGSSGVVYVNPDLIFSLSPVKRSDLGKCTSINSALLVKESAEDILAEL